MATATQEKHRRLMMAMGGDDVMWNFIYKRAAVIGTRKVIVEVAILYVFFASLYFLFAILAGQMAGALISAISSLDTCVQWGRK